MSRILIATAVLASLIAAGAVPSRAADACAGQSWPNESEACIDQKVKQLSATLTQKTKPAKAQVKVDAVKTNR
jgi:uncharacterized protein YecT (DUF1311 family)